MTANHLSDDKPQRRRRDHQEPELRRRDAQESGGTRRTQQQGQNHIRSLQRGLGQTRIVLEKAQDIGGRFGVFDPRDKGLAESRGLKSKPGLK